MQKLTEYLGHFAASKTAGIFFEIASSQGEQTETNEVWFHNSKTSDNALGQISTDSTGRFHCSLNMTGQIERNANTSFQTINTKTIILLSAIFTISLVNSGDILWCILSNWCIPTKYVFKYTY